MEKLGEKLMPIVFVAYFVVGFVQLFAVADGISLALGIPSFLAYIAALFLTWIPLVGFVAGVYGAHVSWGWSWLWAILLFGWPFVFGLIAMTMSGIVEFFSRKSN